MITENTLFILGAGASASYGYPTGSELRRLIIKEFVADFHNSLFPQERIHLPNSSFIKEFAYAFDKSDDILIDYFLHTCNNESYVNIGKQAIALYIQKADEQYLSSWNIEFNKDDWYPILFSKLIDGINDPKYLSERKINFITFNYDRLVEYKLLTSVKYKYGIAWDKASEYISHIKIKHVFGEVNFISPAVYQLGRKDFFQTDYQTVVNNAKTIKTIGERNSLDLSEIRDLIANASRIIFLGFGFNQENIDLLNIKHDANRDTKIFGTSFKLNENRVKEITNKISLISYDGLGLKHTSTPTLESLICSELLAKYL